MTDRILLLADFYPPFLGGAELQTQLLAQELARRGHSVMVASVWHQGLVESEETSRVAVRRLRGLSTRFPWAYSDPGKRRYHPPFPDPAISRGILRLIKEFKPDLMHAHGWIAYSARLASSRAGVPLAISARDFGYACPTRTLFRNDRICSGAQFGKCLRHAGRNYGAAKALSATCGVLGLRRWLLGGVADVHVASAFAGEMARRDLLAPCRWDDVRLMPNMIPERTANPTAPTRTADAIGRLPREPFILFVGALQRHKGLAPLMQAYARLNSPPPLVLIGTTWPDTPRRWPPGVTVLADIPHETVKEIWPRAMFGVMPSLVPETFGGVVTEAMQGGRPMIATAIGGALDTIQPGETGLLVPPGDVTALADAMRTLIADGPLRERMGALAATRAVERYSADVVVPRFEALYAGMIARARGCREVGREAGIRA